MKKRKIFAVVMAAVMTLSMVACGEKQTGNDVTPTTAPTATTAPTQAPEPTQEPAPQNVTIADASITFEDGNMGFMDVYSSHARSAKCELSIVDFNGSKALKVVNTTGKSKCPFVAIDVSSFLGANVTKVAGVEMVIGTSHGDGKFYSVSGEIGSWWGADAENNTLGSWSVYMEKKNPKVVTAKVPAGNELVADAYNIIYIGMTTDNGASDADVCGEFYIDDIRFFDAAGNTLKGDTTVAFNWPNLSGPDRSYLYDVNNAVEFPGFTTKGAAWGQDGFAVPQEIWDALVPGSVVEIEFSSEDGTLWVVMPDAAAGWSRIAQGKAYINESATTAQIPYEAFVEICGEDKSTWGERMQCEAQTAWEVYSVKVGTASRRMAVSGTVEFPDFVTKAGAWAQDGYAVPQEIWDALVPGSVVEIDYTSEDGALWIVMPDAAAGWSRCGQGTAACTGSKCYVTYEQIEAVCGSDKSTWGERMQCEGSSAWEVYGLRVGTKLEYPVLGSFVDFPDFAKKAGAWAQDGLDMPEAIINALVPGAVVEISYTSEDGDIWIVMPDAAAGWSRIAQGAALKDNGKAYITYEQIAAVCGEDKSTWGARMQCEGSSAWEVYAVRVGQGPVAAAAAPEKPAKEDPTIQVADGTVAFTGSKTFSDTAWWTQLSWKDAKADIIGTVAPEEITAIKFTADTNFVLGFKDVNGEWVQTENVDGPFVIHSMELGDDWDLCLALSKGDGVEYTITWEVYTGGSKEIIFSSEPVVDPTTDTIEGEVVFNNSLTFSDSAWWTQKDLFLADLIGDLDPATVAGIKFTSNTAFFLGFSDTVTGAWWQKDAESFVAKTIDFNKEEGQPVVCLYLSKGDGVEYTINWEVYTNGEAAGTDTPAADAVTGNFSGVYAGDYAAEWIPADAFAACTDGAKVTINYTLQTEGRTNQWWNLTFIKGDWSKYLDAKYYIGEVPAFSQYEFVAMEGTSYTFTLSADALAQIKADGKFGLQTDGVIFNSYSVEAAK